MRFLDVAVGSGYGALCLSLIVIMSPVASSEAAHAAASQSRLDSEISRYIDSVGLPFLSGSSMQAVCDSAAAASNRTLVLDAFEKVGGCPSIAEPASPLASSSLTLDLPGRVLVIEAWLARQ